MLPKKGVEMKYRLLDSGVGIAITRRAQLLNEILVFEFAGADEGLLILENEEGIFFYRDVLAGRCEIEISKLQGAVKVTFVVKGNGDTHRKWVCEPLFVDHIEQGGALVCPDDMNLPQVVADLRVENEAMRRDAADLRESIKALNERFDALLEGWDIT